MNDRLAKAAGKLSGLVSAPVIPEGFDAYGFDSEHTNTQRDHGVSEDEAREFVKDALIMETRNGGVYQNFYGILGSAYTIRKQKKIKTAFKAAQYAPNIQAMIEVVSNELGKE